MIDYDIREAALTESLPLPLQFDPEMSALAAATEEQLRKNAADTEKAVIYARIDELPESVIDTLAVDMHVDWYYSDAALDIKRRTVKESVSVHKTLGTRFAVEQAIGTYFGGAEVSEWFEYGGEPGCFRLATYDLAAVNARYLPFLKILEKVKRKSARLESLELIQSEDTAIYAAALIQPYVRIGVTVDYTPKIDAALFSAPLTMQYARVYLNAELCACDRSDAV
jgi:phage tail P2-like protein